MRMMSSDNESQGQLRIELGFSLLYWPLFLVRPSLAIDNEVERTRWGAQTRTLPEGKYTLAIWFRWLVLAQAGRADLTVEIHRGHVTWVRYRPVVSVLAATVSGHLVEVAPTLAAPMQRR